MACLVFANDSVMSVDSACARRLVGVGSTERQVGGGGGCWLITPGPRLDHSRAQHAEHHSSQREHTGRDREHHLPRLARLLQIQTYKRSFCSRVSFFMFFHVFKMFLVGLATVVRLCFMSDIVLLID